MNIPNKTPKIPIRSLRINEFFLLSTDKIIPQPKQPKIEPSANRPLINDYSVALLPVKSKTVLIVLKDTFIYPAQYPEKKLPKAPFPAIRNTRSVEI
jgi:hypothetical protein